MTVVYLAGNRLQGLSSDTKPTTVPSGSRFEETDTFDDWKYNGTDWVLMTGCFNPNATESLKNKNLTDSTNTFRAWVNADIGSSAAVAWSKISKTGSLIADIGNVAITSVAAGDKLGYDGTNWVNSKAANMAFSNSFAAITTFGARYWSFWTAATGSNGTTESTFQIAYPSSFVIKRIFCRATANTLNGATTVGVRDDGATAASVSIPAAGTTMVDSGALSVNVASGSLVNWIVDTSASSSGSLTIGSLVALVAAY